MPSESQIQNCKKIVDEELWCFLQKHDVEKAFDKIKEKITPLVDSIFALQGETQEVDEFFEKLENSPEMAVCFKYNNNIVQEMKDNIHAYDPNLTYEENFRNGFLFGFDSVLKRSSTKVPWINTGKKPKKS